MTNIMFTNILQSSSPSKWLERTTQYLILMVQCKKKLWFTLVDIFTLYNLHVSLICIPLWDNGCLIVVSGQLTKKESKEMKEQSTAVQDKIQEKEATDQILKGRKKLSDKCAWCCSWDKIQMKMELCACMSEGSVGNGRSSQGQHLQHHLHCCQHGFQCGGKIGNACIQVYRIIFFCLLHMVTK